MYVIKRDGALDHFDTDKISAAVSKAASRTEDIITDRVNSDILDYVVKHIGDVAEVKVDTIHKLVENSLMDVKAFDTAREYVSYRSSRKPSIFAERIAYKPLEYPSVLKYVDAMQQSYWIVSEFNFQKDIQEYKAEMTQLEKQAVRKSMLAISQIEVAVKKFWSRIGDRMPKPEIEEVGASFGESEIRHHRSYSTLLEQLGLNNEFDNILDIPAMKKRINYAQRVLSASKADNNRDFMEAVLLFSLFIENVSLFSQFLIISQINKETGQLAGMSNVISATSLEEQLHAQFGADLINIIRDEHPDWFTDDLAKRVHEMVDISFDAEKDIVDWIFEEGDLPYLSRDDVVEYIKNRYNTGLRSAGYNDHFDVDEQLLENTKWFDVQNKSTSHTDFFAQRSVNYTKGETSFDEDDLF